jgi:hypothetical protein
MRFRPSIVVIGLAAAVVAASPASAQGERYALIVAGASGDPELATLHQGWVNSLTAVLRTRYKFDPARLTVLVEQPAAGQDRATAENVRATLGRLAKQVKADDLLLVMLIGHGSGAGAEAKFNLVGPDLTVADWNELLKPLPSRLAFVNASSASFPFIAGLSGPNRIVITATSTRGQVYHPMFADAFIKALAADIADSDKNGRLSMMEIFTYATRLVTEHYDRLGQLATEGAVFDDNGDGTARDIAKPGPDGDVAGLTYLDVLATPTSSDPATQALLTRQAQLTQQIDELRKRRQSIPAVQFDKEFEELIIELSLVSRELRRKGG